MCHWDPLLRLVFIINNTIINKKRKEKGLCRILLTLSKGNKKIYIYIYIYILLFNLINRNLCKKKPRKTKAKAKPFHINVIPNQIQFNLTKDLNLERK